MSDATRRSIIGVAGVAAAASLLPGQVEAMENARSLSELTMHRHGSVPIVGNAGASYGAQGAAFTAQSTFLFGSAIPGASVLFAAWRVAWTPFGFGGIRLLHFNPGPSDFVEVARFERSAPFPVADAIVITSTINALLAAGQTRVFTFETRGNGSVGPAIYSSVIELVWG
jgi:hypothetical protein